VKGSSSKFKFVMVPKIAIKTFQPKLKTKKQNGIPYGYILETPIMFDTKLDG